jgi:hypothetical protein
MLEPAFLLMILRICRPLERRSLAVEIERETP